MFRRNAARSLARALVLLVAVASLVPAAAGRRPRARPKRGRLAVQCNVEGATVLVDGREVGRTPLSKPISGLAPGRHAVGVRKPGYLPVDEVVRVRPGKTATLEVLLLPTAGVLTVRSDPEGAEVFVNGVLAGTTPLRDWEVVPGEVTLIVRAPGHEPYRADLRIRAGEARTLDLSLEPLGATPPPAAVSTELLPPPAKDGGLPWGSWWLWAAVGAAVLGGTALAVAASSAGPVEVQDPSHLPGGPPDVVIRD